MSDSGGRQGAPAACCEVRITGNGVPRSYTQIASNVVAAQDVNITAAEIELLTANETGYNSQSDKDLKIGVSARIKSPFIDLINNVDSAAGPVLARLGSSTL